MTDNKINSVKIIHDELYGEEYRLISDFLRLVGVIVCNATYQDNRLDDDKFDLVIYIENENSSYENLAKLRSILGNKLVEIQGRASFIESGDGEYRKEVMQKFFKAIEDSSYYLMDDDIKDWRELFDIYLENDFIKNRRFVYFRDEVKYAESAKDSFIKMTVAIAYLSLRVKQSERQSRYIDYASLYLAYLINECCSYLQQNFVFDSEKLYELIEQSAVRYSDFENYYLLMAFLTELDSVLTLKGERCYERAEAKLKGFSYANYAYYRFGRYCEMALKNEEKARDYYSMAYNANPREYRAIYKLGYFALKDRNNDKAVFYFREIISLLDAKYKNNILQENEYEYYFKCCKVLENIGKNTGDRQMTEFYESKAEELLTRISEGSSNQNYVISFNKEEANERLKATYSRLKGRTMDNSLWKVKNAINA